MGTEGVTSRTEQCRKVLLLETTVEYRQTQATSGYFEHFSQSISTDGMDLKHYSTMPESIDETSIKPESYVVIDDIRVMGLKHGSQRECLYKFFTMYSHHHKLNVFFLSQSFDNIKDMKINANFLYLFRFTDKANVKRYIDTLFGGKCNKSNLVYTLYEKLLEKCERPALAIDCSHNKYYTYCDGQSLKVDFEF